MQAEKEWAWCEREMTAAAKALGFDGPSAWTDALAAVSADHAPPGEQPDIIKRLADEAIEFLEERDLVTIPPLAKVLPVTAPAFWNVVGRFISASGRHALSTCACVLPLAISHCFHLARHAGKLEDGDDDCRAAGRQPIFHRRRGNLCLLPIRANVACG